MTMHNDRDRNILKSRTRDSNMTWVLGALAALAVLGLLIWALSGDNTNTAGTGGDTTTGSASRPAPAPAPPASRQ